MSMDEHETIETTNINLAAACLTEGKDAHLDEQRVDRTDPRHVKVVVVGERVVVVVI